MEILFSDNSKKKRKCILNINNPIFIALENLSQMLLLNWLSGTFDTTFTLLIKDSKSVAKHWGDGIIKNIIFKHYITRVFEVK